MYGHFEIQLFSHNKLSCKIHCPSPSLIIASTDFRRTKTLQNFMLSVISEPARNNFFFLLRLHSINCTTNSHNNKFHEHFQALVFKVLSSLVSFMHERAPYLYLQKNYSYTRSYMYKCTCICISQNKGLNLVGLFILNQLFQALEGNIFSTIKFHELWKAGIPVLSIMTTDLQLHRLTKSCSSADAHFIYLQLRDAIQLLLKPSQFCNSSAKTLELAAQSCPWQVPAETRLAHQTQLSSSYPLPWLSSFAWKHLTYQPGRSGFGWIQLLGKPRLIVTSIDSFTGLRRGSQVTGLPEGTTEVFKLKTCCSLGEISADIFQSLHFGVTYSFPPARPSPPAVPELNPLPG